ncbi:hypothetical protein [Micromonospora sp. CPCC 205558]|uniref:hypothetical protein n=1 Tax=Micromonospora sp. CPCC 205558 TaxID=3122403 RepID=UPI002FF42DFC
MRYMILVNRATGVEAAPVIVDRSTGRPLDDADFVFAAGPAASETTRRRYQHIAIQATPQRPGPAHSSG